MSGDTIDDREFPPRPLNEAEALKLWMRNELAYVWQHKLDFDEMTASLRTTPMMAPESKWGRLIGHYWHRAQLLLQQDENGSLRLDSVRALAKETGGMHGLVAAVYTLFGNDDNAAHEHATSVVETGALLYTANLHSGSTPTADLPIKTSSYPQTALNHTLQDVAAKIDDWRLSNDPGTLQTGLTLSEMALIQCLWQLQDYAREPDGTLLLPVPGYSSTDKVPAWQST